MIAKRVPRQSGHSSYRHLAEYILDLRHAGRKVAGAWTTNTSVPDDFQLAIIETQATQELNTRSKIDKTYHLVISLAQGEKLTADQFRNVEQRCCAAIGLGEHHRICAIHHDTDNLHLHMAISKVHPVTLNTIEPFYDKFKLQEVCREFEKAYNLQVDVGRERSEQLTSTQAHRGLQSFQSWIKTHLRSELLALVKEPEKSWQDAQGLCGKYGIQIREHGNGLVFSHVDRELFVKASAVDRSFSKQSMESKLGKFEPASHTHTPVVTYQCAPLGGGDKARELYAAYQKQMAKIRAECKEQLKVQMDKRSSGLHEIKARYAARRQQVKLDPILTRARKFEIQKALTAQMKGEILRNFSAIQDERRAVRKSHATTSWREWLRHQAHTGNETAQLILAKMSPIPPAQDRQAPPSRPDYFATYVELKNNPPRSKEPLPKNKGMER